jgi:hypothetical protein
MVPTPPADTGRTMPTRSCGDVYPFPIEPGSPGSWYVRKVVKRATGVEEFGRTSATATGYTSPQAAVPGLQFRYSVDPGEGQAADADDDDDVRLGSTLTHAVATPPPPPPDPPGVTATSGTRRRTLVGGVPEVACCSCEKSSRRL